MIDFIGVGAQKAGTSWVYACLYEHPEICAPIKELHFFSRERFSKGRIWYEEHFARCATETKRGEFSTSYLYTPEVAARIAEYYPDVKIIAIVRNPVDRAISHYRNAIKTGEIDAAVSFDLFCQSEPSVINQGYYSEQLNRYYDNFPSNQILVLVYEESLNDPAAFMRAIYTHIGVDPHFQPQMLHRVVNVARTPRLVALDRGMHRVAEWLRRHGLDRVVHTVRCVGITDLIRGINTDKSGAAEIDVATRQTLLDHYRTEVETLEKLLKRDLKTIWSF